MHPECEFIGECMLLAGDHCLTECRKAKDEEPQDIPDLAWASYVYARATCEPSQLAHLPNAAAYERRYREIFMRGPMPIDTETKPPVWGAEVEIPKSLRKPWQRDWVKPSERVR